MDKEVQDYLINKIKSEYTEKTDIEFDKLMKLDRKSNCHRQFLLIP